MDDTLAFYALCQIGRGPFSGERTFTVRKADGEAHTGLSPVSYCHRLNGDALQDGEPSGDDLVEGLIDVYFISNGGDQARINLPDGKTISVGTDQLVRQRIKGTEYVSFRSGHPVGS